jgi:hypothetical protein
MFCFTVGLSLDVGTEEDEAFVSEGLGGFG